MNDPGNPLGGVSTVYSGRGPSGGNGANGPEGNQQRVFTEPHPIGYENTFAITPPAPKVLIPGILPCEVFGLVGPGGTAKTTFALWLMINIILDRVIFERRVNGPGPCLLISAEDNAGLIRYRVNRLCDAMGLSEAQNRKVAAELYIEDITGKIVKFVEVKSDGNLGFSNLPDEIVATYSDVGIRLTVCDPATFFGAGERFVNDNESTLMQAGRRIQQGLGSGAFGYIHHTGQAAAREGITDQYAGRGGTAFADNSRGMLVMQFHKQGDKFYMPRAISTADVADGRVMRLHIAKFSVGPRESEPLWVTRGKENPWSFNGYEAPPMDAEEKAERALANSAAEDVAAVEAVVAHVKSERASDRFPTRSTVKNSKFVDRNGRQVPNAGKPRLIDIALQQNQLVELNIPKQYRRGQRKEYLDVGPEITPPTDD
ncbi:MAG: AAA family ATPase [Proteobacteria bacterium]|nr:AAA family ATPase [Pseudomonadota bacterium]